MDQDLVELLEACEEKWGKEFQLLMAIEECAELQKAILKYFRRKDNNKMQIAEECVDVALMVSQIVHTLGIEKEYEEWWKIKIARLQKELAEND